MQSYLDLLDPHDKLIMNDIDLDDMMVSAVHVGRHEGTKPSDLTKLWRIDADTASKTIVINSQMCVLKDNPKLSYNYGTNYRMLRYKHLKEYFYMDTLFETSKSKKSSIGNTCAKLFVTNKDFVYIVPMTKDSDVLQAVTKFCESHWRTRCYYLRCGQSTNVCRHEKIMQ